MQTKDLALERTLMHVIGARKERGDNLSEPLALSTLTLGHASAHEVQ